MQRPKFRWNAYIIALCLITSREANASDEGCTIILCLSNPAGWSVVAECVAPVQRVLKAMAKGRMPQCTFSSGPGSDARIVWVTEPATLGDNDNKAQITRALEYRDATGVIRRIKF